MNECCLCSVCHKSLIDKLKEDNKSIKFKGKEHLSGHTPCIELNYDHENGNNYCKEIYADANYCCQCGVPL